MMDQLDTEGRSPRTIQASRNALGRLLGKAKQDGLVAMLATSGVSNIRRTPDEYKPSDKALEPQAIGRVLEAASERWRALLMTLAFLGLRRGEALGLRWRDIDLDDGLINIERSLSRVSTGGRSALTLNATKTKGSRRVLHPPAELLEELTVWQEIQDAERLAAGEHWGGGEWAEIDLVFTAKTGLPIDPDNLRHALSRIGRRAGVGHIHPHQFRHSVASLLISEGYTPPEVSKILGHSSPSMTLDYYAHAFEQASVNAAGAMATAIHIGQATDDAGVAASEEGE